MNKRQFNEITKWQNETQEETRKGNPIARFRFRYQTFTIPEDYPLESEWEQFKDVAIRCAAKTLIHNFKKFGRDDLVCKVFDEMNHKKAPYVITLQKAYKLLSNENLQSNS